MRWTALQNLMVLLLCVAVATASSLPWLVKPDLQPGVLAPFDAVAPKDALVRDNTALEQRRSAALGVSAIVLQRHLRGFLARRRFARKLRNIG